MVAWPSRRTLIIGDLLSHQSSRAHGDAEWRPEERPSSGLGRPCAVRELIPPAPFAAVAASLRALQSGAGTAMPGAAPVQRETLTLAFMPAPVGAIGLRGLGRRLRRRLLR